MAVLPIQLTIQGINPKDRKNTPFYVSKGTLTLAEISALANNYAALVNATIDGAVVEAHVLIPISLSGAITGKTIEANAHTNVGATFSFRNSAGNAESIFFPTFDTALLSNDIPLTGIAAVEDIVDAWVTGVTDGGTVRPAVDPNELDIVSAVRAFKSTRR